MALLDLINSTQDELSLPRTSAVVAATDNTTRQLLTFANRTGRELVSDYVWAELEREHTWTLVSGTAEYALPADMDRHIPDTHWDRNYRWGLMGPVTPQVWQAIKSGVIASGPRRRFRVKGRADGKIFIDPTPASGDTGQIMVLEYVSASWARPRTWAASVVYAANTYTSYNGNYYKTTAGGTTGATPPTHTTGSVSDGTVTWAFNSELYNAFRADTDVALISESLLGLGIQWRYLRSHGFSTYVGIKGDFDRIAAEESQKLRGATVLNLGGRSYSQFITSANAPQTGFGV